MTQHPKRLLAVVILSATLTACTTLPKPKGVSSYVEGSLLLDYGDRDKAIAALVEATSRNPRLILARTKLGDIYREDGEYGKAAEQYEKVVQLDPYTAQNHYKLGVSYQFLNRIQEAVLSYLRALQLDPQDPRSAMNAGLCYLALNQPDNAVKYTQTATELAPKMAATWSNHGVALDAKGAYPEAERAYQRALEIETKNPVTLYNLASNLVEQKKYRQAAPILEGLVAELETATSRKRLGDAYVGLNRLDEAMKQYVAACQIDKNYYPAFNEAGRTLIAKYSAGRELDERHRESAVLMWKQSLKINPNQPKVEALVKQWDRGTRL